jgi:hypothetical protein
MGIFLQKMTIKNQNIPLHQTTVQFKGILLSALFNTNTCAFKIKFNATATGL